MVFDMWLKLHLKVKMKKFYCLKTCFSFINNQSAANLLTGTHNNRNYMIF